METIRSYEQLLVALPALDGSEEACLEAIRLRVSVVDKLSACWNITVIQRRYEVSEEAANLWQACVFKAAQIVLARYTSASWWRYHFREPDNDRGVTFVLREEVLAYAKRFEQHEYAVWQNLSRFGLLIFTLHGTLVHTPLTGKGPHEIILERQAILLEAVHRFPLCFRTSALVTHPLFQGGRAINDATEHGISQEQASEQFVWTQFCIPQCLLHMNPSVAPGEEHVITWESMARRRGAADTLRAALTFWNMAPEQTLMIGASVEDEEFAFLAHVSFAWAHEFFVWLPLWLAEQSAPSRRSL